MLQAVLTSLRPRQWTKNLFVFAALAFSKHLFELGPFVRTLGAFVLFCGLSGTVYLLNDLVDLERDRLHPIKCLRPLARGNLSVALARGIVIGLGTACLALAVLLDKGFALAALGYLLLNLAYSFWLKNVVILDAIVLSVMFVLRAVAGGLVISVGISTWLLLCTTLLALFLALAKRRNELLTLEDAAGHRAILAEYSPYLLDQMIGVVTASCLMAYSFYTMAPETVEKFRTDRLAYTIPFVLYGIFRYLYLVHRKEGGGSPSEVLLTDKPLLAAVALWAAAVILIVYTAPGAPVPLGALPGFP